ncbi:MAG: hypothetical protein WBH03_09405, partial [Cyclobacteriaceae bacterium]
PIDPIDQLPPLTTEGKGTFGCLVNGEAFVSRYPDALADYTVFDNMNIRVDFKSPQSALSITLRNYNMEEGYMEVKDSSTAFFTIYANSRPFCDYSSSELIDGWVNIIEFEPFEEFISGDFELIFYDENCDTVRITDGRFDLPLVW